MKKRFSTHFILKITSVCLLFFLTIQVVSAQCKKKVDEFTNAVTISTDVEKIGKNKEGFMDFVKFLKVEMTNTNGRFALILMPEYRTIQTIEEGEIVYIKFQNDSIMKLPVQKTSISDHTKGEAFVQGTETTIWYNFLWFSLTPLQVSELEANKIKKIRCGINDYEIKEDKADIIQEQIACIKKKMG